MDEHLLRLQRMRLALAMRDVTKVFTILYDHNHTLGTVAERFTNMRVDFDALVCGGTVTDYRVLERICVALKVPRSYMGLGYDPSTQRLLMQEADIYPPFLGD